MEPIVYLIGIAVFLLFMKMLFANADSSRAGDNKIRVKIKGGGVKQAFAETEFLPDRLIFNSKHILYSKIIKTAFEEKWIYESVLANTLNFGEKGDTRKKVYTLSVTYKGCFGREEKIHLDSFESAEYGKYQQIAKKINSLARSARGEKKSK